MAFRGKRALIPGHSYIVPSSSDDDSSDSEEEQNGTSRVNNKIDTTQSTQNVETKMNASVNRFRGKGYGKGAALPFRSHYNPNLLSDTSDEDSDFDDDNQEQPTTLMPTNLNKKTTIDNEQTQLPKQNMNNIRPPFSGKYPGKGQAIMNQFNKIDNVSDGEYDNDESEEHGNKTVITTKNSNQNINVKPTANVKTPIAAAPIIMPPILPRKSSFHNSAKAADVGNLRSSNVTKVSKAEKRKLKQEQEAQRKKRRKEEMEKKKKEKELAEQRKKEDKERRLAMIKAKKEEISRRKKLQHIDKKSPSPATEFSREELDKATQLMRDIHSEFLKINKLAAWKTTKNKTNNDVTRKVVSYLSTIGNFIENITLEDKKLDVKRMKLICWEASSQLITHSTTGADLYSIYAQLKQELLLYKT